MAKIGIEPGKAFDINQHEPEIAQAINKSVKIAQQKIKAHDLPDAGNLYLQRAYRAAFALERNLPDEVISVKTMVDSRGEMLNGKRRYVIHFPKDRLPPVKGFWSLTLYDYQYFFFDNAIDRYALSPRSNLKMNADGSVDLLIQHDSPGREKASNWLPAPQDDFILMWRFYWPDQNIINGMWAPPAVEIRHK
jgi:DNA sulfur modification protein DndE